MPQTDKKKMMTLPNFHAWLSGVEEMQEDDWTPTDVQWKKIREKIFSIEIPSAPPAAVQPQQVLNPAQYQPPAQSMVSAFEQQEQPAPRVDMSQRAPIAKDPTGKIPVKTPDIDTLDGTYESSFE